MPPHQPFRLQLSAPKMPLPDFGAVRSDSTTELRSSSSSSSSSAAEGDTAGGKPY
jgi:hypothetical protein